jgi:hypothetical protein
MKLKYVAITGADDNVSIEALNEVARKYPFVECALLYMPEQMGQSRFPSQPWFAEFAADYKGAHRAMHLCGSAFLGFVENRPDIIDAIKGFHRIQLNLEFGGVDGQYDPEKLLAQIAAHPGYEFVIQYTEKRRNLLPALEKIPNHALLFDTSAGRGVSPDSWPSPLPGHFCGYAGGIGPDNVLHNLEKIAQTASGCDTWIDMESGIRSDDRFDLAKVKRVLELATPFTF